MDQNDDARASAADGRSRWGRARFGGGRVPALGVAAPLGLVLSLGLAALALATGSAGPQPVIGGIAVAIVVLWPCVGLVWALIVDRATVRGAVADPEQSVEALWYERAASGAFTDVLLVVGLGTAAIALASLDVPVVLALVGVILVAAGSFGVRYLLLSRRG